MAAERSPCRCFKTRVLHFKVKNIPLKDKKWKEKVQKNAQLSLEKGKLFTKKSFFEEFNLVFFTAEPMVCFEMQPKSAKILLNFQVHFALYGPYEFLQKLNRKTSACSERGRKSGIPCSKVLPHNAAVVWITLWFLVRFRIIFKILTITFKAIYNMAPKYLSDLITFKTRTMCHLRSNNKFLLSKPSVKTRRGDRAFVVAAPKLWNDLAYDIRIISDFTSIK